ncbi:MAG: peptidoglycan-associated lipoprotein [Acidobacteriota bacterium]|jgi:outer membrane protein OmpA-like peptidoglycan-associated protein|nr:peptidoglycan-associated lipoprotein [Acidobacteriota bacterium]
MTSKPYIVALALATALVGTTGCATKKYVKQETGAVNTRVDEVQGQVEQSQTRLNAHEGKLNQHDQQIGDISKTAQEALDRAQQAGKLAQGKFLYETVLTDEKVKFGFDTADLSPEAQAAIDEFAAKIKEQNQNVYIEIQGHTDNVGSAKYNEELGLLRAESVRRYLNQKHGFPLHRINVISYGETAAVADNGNRQGRAQNRRVALVVLE